MKKLSFLLVATITFVSCNSSTSEDTLNTEGASETEEINEAQDTVDDQQPTQEETSNTKETAEMNEPDDILEIKKWFKNINTSEQNYTKKEDKDINVSKSSSPDNYSHESEEVFRVTIINLTRLYDGDNLKKATVTFDGDRSDLTSDYYFNDSKLFFVFKTMKNYSKPKWDDAFDAEDFEQVEHRFYFKDDQLIRWIDQDNKQVDVNEATSKEIAAKVLSDAQLYQGIE